MDASKNTIPKIGLALMLVFFGYCAIVEPSQEFGLLGYVLLYAALFPTFATMYIAASRAHRAGSWPWFVAAIVAWPASYVYALCVNRDG